MGEGHSALPSSSSGWCPSAPRGLAVPAYFASGVQDHLMVFDKVSVRSRRELVDAVMHSSH
jgi:hypothetical protein